MVYDMMVLWHRTRFDLTIQWLILWSANFQQAPFHIAIIQYCLVPLKIMDDPKSVKKLKELDFGDKHFTDALNSIIAESELELALENAFKNVTDNFYDDTTYLDYLAYFKK